ncbi:MAG TPA: RNA polymerase subunit sigma-24 [Chloroflexi bacterium]|jgi:RNA polymerase sigma-70 factor (ECF subfamily)|nr:RNA polymerase subunit sigma-24 [Chloroflexota bacterium]
MTNPEADASVPASAFQATGEEDLLDALRQGDEATFVFLVTRYHAALVRLARTFVADQATAEEVVQETWLAVLNGIEKFEARSSLKTWIFRILMNRAKTRGVRDKRSAPFSSLDASLDQQDPAVDPDRFTSTEDGQWSGHWLYPPTDWDVTPEQVILSSETREIIERTIASLPPGQRQVITLRDLEGWSAAEVCNALGLSETNGRVLLHRARAKVRSALEQYFMSESTS